ncbi:hypothetical protein LWI29_028601 [Acer saccharum]|uniref:Uncharacterized protein n=1 Tax=Acer saccharum TaxID=4024 RepID=A0AA39RRM6_ACESA|nr:hypothetical protein LWI29_036837 [Acer saccharum]KAK0579608.1 hypothetical protein LWI29_028601 [Acer saccharum]
MGWCLKLDLDVFMGSALFEELSVRDVVLWKAMVVHGAVLEDVEEKQVGDKAMQRKGIGQITCLKTLTLFFIGKKRGFHLVELKALDLGGELRIKHLNRVGNPMDAKEAIWLENKTSEACSPGDITVNQRCRKMLKRYLKPLNSLQILNVWS